MNHYVYLFIGQLFLLIQVTCVVITVANKSGLLPTLAISKDSAPMETNWSLFYQIFPP